MTYKTITLSLKNLENAERLCAYACMVARKFNAHLIGVHTIPALEVYPGMMAPANLSQMTGYADKQKKISADIKKIFEHAVQAEDFVSEWREVDAQYLGSEHQLMADWIGADLVIIGQSNPDRDRRDQRSHVENAVRNSGRPVLVLPYAGKFEAVGDNILLGWSGTRESTRAAHDALPFIKAAKATQIFWVGKQDDRTHYLEQTAREMAVGLDRHGAKVTVTHREPGGISIGDELLNEASDRGTDLIVTGGFGHSRVYDFVLGATTSHILKCMTVPVMFSH
jgi:nucleotide-binding universal stress UspA family protein